VRLTDVDRRLADVAARQHGVFNRDQAFTAGASDRFIRRRLAEGAWVRLDTCVYGTPHAPGTWLRQLKIAELGAKDAAIAGRAAAALHGLTGFRPSRPEIAVPLTTRSRSTLADVHRYAGARTTTVKGFRVTTIAQTLFDIAARRTDPWRLERAMDDALLAGHLILEELEERLVNYRGAHRHGVALMRVFILERREDGWTPPESELEAKAARVLAKACDGWVRQYPLPFRGPIGGRVDFALPSQRLIVEADGRRWHARVADFDRDRWRDNEAVAEGWRVLRLTWAHLEAAEQDVIRLVRRTLARAA
jgi:hypothetical protein